MVDCSDEQCQILLFSIFEFLKQYTVMNSVDFSTFKFSACIVYKDANQFRREIELYTEENDIMIKNLLQIVYFKTNSFIQ